MRAVLAVALLAGCYHYSYEHRAPQPGEQLVRHEHRVPTYLNGFVGTGSIDVTKDCADPIRTELEVRATDVLLSVVTLLIYTPHTLYVTCPTSAGRVTARNPRSQDTRSRTDR